MLPLVSASQERFDPLCSTAVAVTASRSQQFEVHLVAVESAAALAARKLPPSVAVVADAAAASACCSAACWSSLCYITLGSLCFFHGFVRLSEQCAPLPCEMIVFLNHNTRVFDAFLPAHWLQKKMLSLHTLLLTAHVIWCFLAPPL